MPVNPDIANAMRLIELGDTQMAVALQAMGYAALNVNVGPPDLELLSIEFPPGSGVKYQGLVTTPHACAIAAAAGAAASEADLFSFLLALRSYQMTHLQQAAPIIFEALSAFPGGPPLSTLLKGGGTITLGCCVLTNRQIDDTSEACCQGYSTYQGWHGGPCGQQHPIGVN
jgi:hypothetical protein